MIKKLALAFSLAVVLVLSLAGAAFASEPNGFDCGPDVTMEWDLDSACGTEYAVGGSVKVENCAGGSYTEFSTSGADLYGDFDAFVGDCGKVVNYFDADVDQGDNCGCTVGTIDYKTVAWSDCSIQKLALYAESDGEAEMEVDAAAKCGQINADFDAEVDGEKGAIGMLAIISGAEKDCEPTAILAVDAWGKCGFDAELDGEMDPCEGEAEVDVDIYSDEGKGGVTLFGAGQEVELEIGRCELEIEDGEILLGIGWNSGVDLDNIGMEVEY